MRSFLAVPTRIHSAGGLECHETSPQNVWTSRWKTLSAKCPLCDQSTCRWAQVAEDCAASATIHLEAMLDRNVARGQQRCVRRMRAETSRSGKPRWSGAVVATDSATACGARSLDRRGQPIRPGRGCRDAQRRTCGKHPLSFLAVTRDYAVVVVSQETWIQFFAQAPKDHIVTTESRPVSWFVFDSWIRLTRAGSAQPRPAGCGRRVGCAKIILVAS
jgi:hypothetical protein